jgi:hypothetical protein
MVAVVAATLTTNKKSIVMKKLTTIVAAIALFFSASAFTPDPGENGLTSIFKVANLRAVSAVEVTRSVAQAFQARYANAKNVSWTQAENFYFADFEMQQGSMGVAYDDKGELLAISRKVSLDRIPMAAAEAIQTQYKDYIQPTEVLEIALMGSTNYYLTVENKTAYLQLKCSPDGSISVEKKIRKKVLVGKVY